MAGSNPTVSRLELAARLRELRQEAGKSLDDAAAELMCSAAKISRMETGGRGVQPRDVRDLCRLYGVPETVRNELNELVATSKAGGWWTNFRSLDERIAFFIGLEDAASEVRIFEALRVPGLLQTASFTEALIRGLRPSGEMSEQQIAEVVAVRQRRQKRVESGELRLHAIVDEAALVRVVGGPEIILEQLTRLLSEASRPNVTLQVIPFSRGSHPGLDGSFQHLRFAGRLDDMIHQETLRGDFILDRADDVAPYRTIFESLMSHDALSPAATRAWLADRTT